MLTKDEKNDIQRLRELTGCGMRDCKNAYLRCFNDIDIAYEYLNLVCHAVARYNIVNGVKVRWSDDDYINAALNRVKSSRCPDKKQQSVN